MNQRIISSYHYYIILTLFLALILVTPKSTLAQTYLKAQVRGTNCPVADHQADRWYFGQNAGLDFRGQDPVADLTNFNLNIPTSAAVISDSNGVVLFYTEGVKVFNRQGVVMQNGDGLHGFVGYPMPVIIIPKPESDSIYYVFTTHTPKQHANDPRTIYGLEYSEINLQRNGGAGEVTLKNKVLLPPEVSSKLSAVKHSNGKDYWVVGHKFNSDEFCAFAVTANGVDTNNYVSSSVGSVHAAPGETNNAIGYMKISPDGTKIGIAVYGSSVFEIFNFDASTGKVSNPITSPSTFESAYGIEFSPDSRYMYGSITPIDMPNLGDTIPDFSCLLQFDVSAGSSIFDTYDTIATDYLGSYFGGLQLGTDGRIYVARAPYGNASLSVIQNPKRPGTDCNFATNAMDLAGKKSRFGFPNFVQSFFDVPHFDIENVCFEDVTNFILTNNSNIDEVSWQFVDGNAVNLSGIQPSYKFTGPGTYDIQVTETFMGKSFGPYTETIEIHELPSVDIGDTVYMYPGSPILLDAGPGHVSYVWSTDENSQSIRVEEPGIYYVTVENELCCFKTDTVLVVNFDIYVPNAFRPGGLNNIFRAYASSYDAINNFSLYIYNRWGQQVFVSGDINQGWDGKIGGKDAPGDVYVWLVTYDVERVGKTEKIAYKGNVILLR